MVQGTLIGYLDKVTKPKTVKLTGFAKKLQSFGHLLLLIGILMEGVDVIDKLFGEGANTIQMLVAIGRIVASMLFDGSDFGPKE